MRFFGFCLFLTVVRKSFVFLGLYPSPPRLVQWWLSLNDNKNRIKHSLSLFSILGSFIVTGILHGVGRNFLFTPRITQAVRAHRRRVHLVGTETHRRGIAGKPNRDAAPPTRAAACNFVLPCGTGVGSARCVRHSLRARTVRRCVRGTHTRPLPARLLPLAEQYLTPTLAYMLLPRRDLQCHPLPSTLSNNDAQTIF